MTTKVKIISGFVIMFALLASIAAFGYMEMRETVTFFTDYRRSARLNVAVSDMEAKIHRAMAETYEYMFSRDAGNIDIALTSFDDFSALAKEAEEITAHPEWESAFQEMQTRIPALKASLVEAIAAADALKNQYTDEVEQQYGILGDALKGLSELAERDGHTRGAALVAGLWDEFFLSIAAVKSFSLSAAKEEGEEAAAHVAGMKTLLAGIGETVRTDEAKQLHGKAMAVYGRLAASLEGMIQKAALAGKAFDDIHLIQHDVSERTASFNQRIDEDMARVGETIIKDNEYTQKLMLLLSALGLFIGAALVVCTITGIIRLLRELSGFASSIANGDFSYRVRSREKGEIGAVFSAMKRIPDVLNRVIDTSHALADGIHAGKLRERGDAASLPGVFADLSAAVNGICDAYTEIIDAMPMPVMSCDKGCNIVFLNKAGQDVVGGEHLGEPCGKMLRAPVCDGDGCLGKKCMGKQAAILEETSISPQGRHMDIAVTAMPLRDTAGNTAGFLEIITDLTEVKKQQRTVLEVARQASAISRRVAGASEELAAQLKQVSHGAEVQREQVESTASAMAEMNATVLEVARNAGEASEQSENTRVKAKEGAELVNDVMGAMKVVNAAGHELQNNMKELGAQAESIGTIMNVISDIADQTNLLALNAAIEAARAGDAGRGFAVVADEVRKLAEKTMEATREVGASIHAVQQSTRGNIEEVNKVVSSVEEVNKLAGSSGEALGEIVALASANSSVVASIATAAEEQSAASEEISRAIDGINRIVGETTEGMVHSASAVQNLSDMARELDQVMEKQLQ